MSKLYRGLRNAMGQAPKPAWVRCPGQRTFCCCITVRTGASVIGWFNFVFNSLYVGMLVFALARTKESINTQMEVIRSGFVTTEIAESSGSSSMAVSELKTFIKQSQGSSAFGFATFSCVSNDEKRSCVCSLAEIYKNMNEIKDTANTTRDCSFLSSGFPRTDCLCDLGKVLYDIIPMMYKSLGIPGFMVLLSILWLTAVESMSMRFLRFVGYTYLLTIPIQLVLQFYYQIYANKKFIESNLGSLHGVVWLVYSVYAILNLYFIPVLHRYIKLRIRERTQGIEQGLLTSERYPPSNQDLDVYLQDAFAIDDDGAEVDRVCYTISGNNDPMQEYLSSNQASKEENADTKHTNGYEDNNYHRIANPEDQPIFDSSSDESDSI